MLPPITEGPTTENPFNDESTVAFTEGSPTTLLSTIDGLDNTSSGDLDGEMNSTTTVEPSFTDDNTTIICNNSNSSTNFTDGEVIVSCKNTTSFTTASTIDSSQSESNTVTTQSESNTVTTQSAITDTLTSTAEPKVTSTDSQVTSTAEKTEPPKISSGNQIPVGNSSRASQEDEGKDSAIPRKFSSCIMHKPWT